MARGREGEEKIGDLFSIREHQNVTYYFAVAKECNISGIIGVYLEVEKDVPTNVPPIAGLLVEIPKNLLVMSNLIRMVWFDDAITTAASEGADGPKPSVQSRKPST
jgi:hypothetical protein